MFLRPAIRGFQLRSTHKQAFTFSNLEFYSRSVETKP